MIAPLALAASLALGPYTGPERTGSIGESFKFAVAVMGTPGATVRLRAVDVPSRFIASFCTDRVCAPFRVSVTLPPSGRTTIELQYVAKETGARPPIRAIVEADGMKRDSIAFARASH